MLTHRIFGGKCSKQFGLVHRYGGTTIANQKRGSSGELNPRPAFLIDMTDSMIIKIFVAAALIVFAAVTSLAQRSVTKANSSTLRAEQLLVERGYWLQKADGIVDSSTRHAVIAFQKVEGLKRTGVINSGLISALEAASRPAPRYSSGTHVEIDINRQVLFLVDEGTVTHVLPVSSGNERPYYEKGKRQIAHTPRGLFKIYSQIKGVRHAPLGTLYFPNYFTGGVAIHGSDSVPPYAASHGCVRIPRFAERAFSSMVHVGTPVYVYD